MDTFGTLGHEDCMDNMQLQVLGLVCMRINGSVPIVCEVS